MNAVRLTYCLLAAAAAAKPILRAAGATSIRFQPHADEFDHGFIAFQLGDDACEFSLHIGQGTHRELCVVELVCQSGPGPSDPNRLEPLANLIRNAADAAIGALP